MLCISIQFPVVVGYPIWSHWWDERTPIVENPGESVTCYSFWLGIDADYEARPNDWNTPDEDAFDGWYAAPADWYDD